MAATSLFMLNSLSGINGIGQRHGGCRRIDSCGRLWVFRWQHSLSARHARRATRRRRFSRLKGARSGARNAAMSGRRSQSFSSPRLPCLSLKRRPRAPSRFRPAIPLPCRQSGAPAEACTGQFRAWRSRRLCRHRAEARAESGRAPGSPRTGALVRRRFRHG